MHRHANKNYLFSKRCFCGLCGSTVTGEYSKRTAARTYYYYACQGHKLRHECDMKRMRADVAEKAACRVLADLLTQPDLMQHFISAALKYQQNITKENAELKMAKSSLVEVQARKNNLLAAIEQGIFTPSTAARLKELEADEDELKNNISRLSARESAGKLSAENIQAFLKAFKDEKVKSEMFVKSLFQELVIKVFLFPDHITLVYDLKNNPAESITLDELLKVENAESRINTGFAAIKKASHQKCEAWSAWLPE